MTAAVFAAIAPCQQIALGENVKPVFDVVINFFNQHNAYLVNQEALRDKAGMRRCAHSNPPKSTAQ